jgi:thymidine kinase
LFFNVSPVIAKANLFGCGENAKTVAVLMMMRFSSNFILGKQMAKLYFHYATMNAGKSTLLLQASYNYRERGMNTLLYTARFDDRAGAGNIGSRIGLTAEARTFGKDTDLYVEIGDHLSHERLHCVFVDEAQFLSKDQVWQLARAADRLGVPVMCYGLRTDFQGELFEGSKALLAICDEMREVRTICRCGKRANMVVRLGPDGKVVRDGEQVVIGGNDRYVSLCRRHFEEETGRWPSEDMVGFKGE